MGPRGTIAGVSAGVVSVKSRPTQDLSAIFDLVFGGRRRELLESSLDELNGLVLTDGATIRYRTIQEWPKLDLTLSIGYGKTETLTRAAR